MNFNVQKKYKTLSINTGIFALANLAARVINFLLLPLYTNVLTTAQFGQAEIILNCVNLVMPFLSLSISDAFLRFGLDSNLDSKDVLRTTSRVLQISSMVTILLCPLFGLYSGIGNYAGMFVIICISQMVRNTFTLYAKVVDRNDVFAQDTVVYTFTLGITNILLLVYAKLGVIGYLLANIAANICSILFSAIKLHIPSGYRDGHYSKELLNEMLRYCVPMIANAVSWWVLQFSDRIMLEHYLSKAEVGIYSVAAKIPNILTMIVGVFTQAWMISSIVEYNKSDSSVFYSVVFKLYLAVLAFCSCGLLCIVKPLMKVYVGADFSDAWQYVPYLIASSFFGSISSFVAPFFGAAKKNVAVTLTTIISAFCNIVLNLILIPRIGTMGAVIATFASYFAVGVIRLYKSKSFVNLVIPHMQFWTVSAVIITLATVVTFSDSLGMVALIWASVLSIVLLFVLFSKECYLILQKISGGKNE